MKNILYIFGFAGCPYFYKACIHAAILKKHGICSEYYIETYDNRKKFKDWIVNHEIAKLNNHTTCPLVLKDNDCIGGCDSLEKYMRETTQHKSV